MPKHPDHLIPTRASLLHRIKDPEDNESWRDFVDTYSGLIYGVARKAGLTDTEAQEVVQETLICVCRKIPGFKYDRAMGSFKGWLLSTTRWRIGDQLRKRRGEAEHCVRDAGTKTRTRTVERIADPAGLDLEGIWDQEWATNLFDAALKRVKRQVNAKHFQIFDFYVLKELPAEKVARDLGVRVAQVYLVSHRIIGRIEKEVKKLTAQPN